MKYIVILLLAFGLAACGESSERDINQQVEEQQAHYVVTQPIPYFDFSMDRDVLIQIYRAKNEARQTYSVVTSQGTGAILFICPSIGYGMPADAQLTNPLQPYRGYAGISEGTVVEQPEPNGTFSSKNTDATYILCVMDNGDVTPVYTEQKVTTFPFPVAVEDGVLVPDGDSSITLEITPGEEGVPPSPSE